ncbi:MAG: VOC family protein [Myxococcales bacterium]|nr:VOC family protein [Myxococcales bacterium]
MRIEAFNHVGICVQDLERSLRFWQEAMGFRRTGDLRIAGEPTATLLGIPGVDLQAVYLECHGLRIELLHYPSPGSVGDALPRAMNQRGLTHFAFRVENLDESVARALECGGRVLEDTRIRNPELGAQVVFVTDPDGSRIEFVQAPGDPEAIPGSSSQD